MAQEIKLALKPLRKKKKMTQKELAERMNVSFQTISKWENGRVMPDISYLPALAEIFEVELEVLLGLKSMEVDTLQHYDEEDYWKNRLECTKNWKMLFYNEDYLEFLVKKVWRIEKPVKILDCACGYGYLGMQLLPLLPEGSSYTGIDICEAYLEEGKRLFSDLPYPADFIQGDIREYNIEETYDVVISQIFLSYLDNPQKVLKKMKQALKPGGMLIAIDNNYALMEEDCFLADERGELQKDVPDWKKIWQYSLEKGEMDWRTGTKLPFLLRQIGLKKVDARISDRVFIYDGTDPLHSKKEIEKYRNIVSNYDWVKQGYMYYMKRGCTSQEAEQFVHYQDRFEEVLQSSSVFAVKACCLHIVWGYLE